MLAHRFRLLGVLSATALVIMGCSQDPGTHATGLTILGGSTLISTESELLSRPGNLALSDRGDLYVLDRQSSHVIMVHADGMEQSVIGREGAGPGELKNPSGLGVLGDTLWVVDQGNARIQGLDLAGNQVSSRPAPLQVGSAPAWVLPGHELLVGSKGQDSSLVYRVNAENSVIARIGKPVAPFVEIWDMEAIRQTIEEGGVPDAFRNFVLMRPDASGDLWVALVSEATLRKYSMEGQLLAEIVFNEPELEAIKAEFVRRNVENENQFSVSLLRYFADIGVVGDEAWLLLNRADTAASTILAVSNDGTETRKITFTDIHGAGSFAVDEARSRFYASIPSLAAAVAVDLPEGAIFNAP